MTGAGDIRRGEFCLDGWTGRRHHPNEALDTFVNAHAALHRLISRRPGAETARVIRSRWMGPV